MGGIDSHRELEQAWRGMRFARRAAERAQAAAERAAAAAEEATAAADRAGLLAGENSATAHMYTVMAERERRSETCQRVAESMHTDLVRRLRRWAALERWPDRGVGERDLPPSLMTVIAAASGWRDAVLSVCGSGGAESLVAASSQTARRAHELQLVLGEGPGWESVQTGASPPASGVELVQRWPRYGPAVTELGVHAVAATRLTLESTGHPASLMVFDAAPAPPAGAKGWALGEVGEAVSETVLHAPDLVGVDEDGLPALEPFQRQDHQPALHQAVALLHARTGFDVDAVTELLRAHAYAEDRDLADVAEDVIHNRRLP